MFFSYALPKDVFLYKKECSDFDLYMSKHKKQLVHLLFLLILYSKMNPSKPDEIYDYVLVTIL